MLGERQNDGGEPRTLRLDDLGIRPDAGSDLVPGAVECRGYHIELRGIKGGAFDHDTQPLTHTPAAMMMPPPPSAFN